MAKNDNLHKAKDAKNDEFYTRIEDVAEELRHYKKHFAGKVVLCNCDDPTWSAFWRYFHLNFSELGLKKLISTHYDRTEPTYKMEYEGGDDNNVEVGVKTPLEGNGDFRNAECIKLLDECDIVVTNPPFSLARAYVQYLREHNKQFIIIGDLNWITYKEIFPMLKNNEVWLGYNSVKEFMQPDGSIKKFGNKLWYTNLDIQKRHEKLILWQRYYDDDGNPLPDAEERYPRYDNYMAINVDKVADIPMDYKPCWFKCGNAESCPFAQEKGMHDAPALCEQPCNGAMGVPITYMDKHNSDEFEVVDANTFISNESVAQKPHGLIKDKDGTITTKLRGAENSLCSNPHPDESVTASWACQSHSSTSTVRSSLKSLDLRQETSEVLPELFHQQEKTDLTLTENSNTGASLSVHKCNGVMGVPITFLDKYNPDEFEIIGHEHDVNGDGGDGVIRGQFEYNGRGFYKRVLIRRKVGA